MESFRLFQLPLFSEVECQPPQPAQSPLARESFMGMPPFWHHPPPGNVWLLHASE